MSITGGGGIDEGKRGEVVQVVPENAWVFIAGRNLTWDDAGGGTIQATEKPVMMQDVSLLDPSDNLPTNMEFKVCHLMVIN